MKKHINLVLALILALGTLPAATVLTVNMMSLSNLWECIGNKPYMVMVIYSEAPLCFACAYIAQRISRSNPIFLAVLFVILKTTVRLLYVYFIAYSMHFWAESALSLVFAIGGAYSASLVNEKENMNHTVRPVTAIILAVALPVLIWMVTLTLSQIR